MDEIYSDPNSKTGREQQQLRETEEENFDDEDKKESFLKRILGSSLKLKGLRFREKMEKLIESNYFHVTVIILVLLDSFCVAAELIITIENTKDISSNSTDENTNGSEKTHHGSSNQKSHAVEMLLTVLKYVGVSILGIFIVEIILKLIFTTKAFLKSKLEIFDAIIVIISFILDIVFFDHHAASAFELLTLLRLWRIARIINGTIVAIKNREELKRERLKVKMRVLQEDNSKMFELLKNAKINDTCTHEDHENDRESHKLKESLQGNYHEIFDEEEKHEPLSKKIFGSHLKLEGLTFRKKIQRIIESNYFHVSVIILVLLDSFCVASELIIIIENKKDHSSNSTVEHTNSSEKMCHNNSDNKFHSLEIALTVLKYIGVTILGIFIVEIALKLGFTTRAFLHSKLELFDAFIVIVSFILDIIFFDHHASAAIELITLLRLWRITRIVNGTIIAIKIREELKREKLKTKYKLLKSDNLKLLTEILKRDAKFNVF